jgi:hypothetical protein
MKFCHECGRIKGHRDGYGKCASCTILRFLADSISRGELTDKEIWEELESRVGKPLYLGIAVNEDPAHALRNLFARVREWMKYKTVQ